MIWQDVVITISGIVFSLSLFPQVWHGYKHKVGPITYQTSVPTFIGLFVISFAYYTLGLFFSSVMCFITGLVWLTLFLQRLQYHQR